MTLANANISVTNSFGCITANNCHQYSSITQTLELPWWIVCVFFHWYLYGNVVEYSTPAFRSERVQIFAIHDVIFIDLRSTSQCVTSITYCESNRTRHKSMYCSCKDKEINWRLISWIHLSKRYIYSIVVKI